MKRTALAIVVLTLILSGCGGDSGTGPQPQDETPIAADTIGTAGGTLVADDFELEVPAGAFDSDAELELYESSADHGFGDNCVSRFFRLEGMPDSFSDTLKIRIDFDGTLSGSTYVAMGEATTLYGDEEEPVEGFVYAFHLATESSGYAEAHIPPGTSGLVARSGAGAASSREDAFLVISGMAVHKTSEHFRVRYPLGLYAYVDDVVNYLEAAHDTVESMGMGYSGKPWSWPAKVLLNNSGGHGITRITVHEGKMCLGMKSSFVTEDNLPQMRVLLGNLMVRSAQRIPSQRAYFEGNHMPWHFAVVCYMQEMWIEPGGFTSPPGFSGKEDHALEGLPLSSLAGESGDRGFAWAAVVKHLTGLYGRKFVGDIYKETQTTSKNAVQALFERAPDPAYNWWPQFVDKYVTGKYYGVEGSVLLLKIASKDKYTIDSKDDTLQTFNHDIPQVSARLNRIYLDYALIAETATLEISLTATGVNEDYYTLLVYKTKDGSMELIGSGNTVTVTDLRDLTIAGYDIIPIEVISYNDDPYTSDVSTQLKYRVTDLPPYNQVYISLNSANILFEDNYGTEWWDDTYGGFWEGEGSWNGNTFHASWANRDLPGVGTATGSLTVTVDPNTKDVLTFRAAETRVSPTGFTFVDSIVGQNVPLDHEQTSPSYHRMCQVIGTGACSSISTFAYRRDHAPTTTWVRSKNHACQTETHLNVSFWYDSGE
jgi:hypothetical protein